MVKEAQDCMHEIEKQIHNFNLALSIDDQIENYQDEQVSWTTFIIAFQKYILASEKLELNDEQLENILS